jgi:hypothetical protein
VWCQLCGAMVWHYVGLTLDKALITSRCMEIEIW